MSDRETVAQAIEHEEVHDIVNRNQRNLTNNIYGQ